ncbi:Inner membrane protein yebS [Edwardsiella tarda]|nr:Inner membrane protein yebS [Edwardsiella tarda]
MPRDVANAATTRCIYAAPIACKKSWAALLAAMVMLLPANLLPISILYVNGTRIEDTILSGVASLAQSGNLPIRRHRVYRPVSSFPSSRWRYCYSYY